MSSFKFQVHSRRVKSSVISIQKKLPLATPHAVSISAFTFTQYITKWYLIYLLPKLAFHDLCVGAISKLVGVIKSNIQFENLSNWWTLKWFWGNFRGRYTVNIQSRDHPPIMLFRSFVGTLGNLSVHVSRQTCHLYRQSIRSANKILKEIQVFECENAKMFKLARCARSHT